MEPLLNHQVDSAVVNDSKRPCHDKLWGAVFMLGLLGQIGFAVWLFVVGDSWAQVEADVCACYASQGLPCIRLRNIGSMIGRNLDVCLGAIAVALAVSFGLISLIRLNARCFAWSAVLFKITSAVALGLYCLQYGSAPTACLLGGYALFLLVMAWAWREKIEFSSRLMEMAGTCLYEDYGVVVASSLLNMVQYSYVAFVLYACLRVDVFGSLDEELCIWEQPDWTTNAYVFLGVMTLWEVMHFDMLMLYTVATSVAYWYFPSRDNDDSSNRNAALVGLQRGLGASFGSIAVGALVLAVMQELLGAVVRLARGTLGCLVSGLVACVNRIIQLYSFSAVVMMALTGESFLQSCRHASTLLTRNFTNGYVSNAVARSLVFGTAWVCALLLGVATWFLIDTRDGLDPFQQGYRGWLWPLVQVLGWLLVVLVLYIRWYGLLWLVFAPTTLSWIFGEGFAMGVFVAVLCSLLIESLCSIVIRAMDSVFILFCVDRQNGNQSQRTALIDELACRLEGYQKLGDIEVPTTGPSAPPAYAAAVVGASSSQYTA